MKTKFFFPLLSSLFGLFLFSSCSKVNEAESNSSFQFLQEEVVSYSESFTANNCDPNTKGPFLKALGNIVLADAFGAAAGIEFGSGTSVFLGVFSSLSCMISEIVSNNIDRESASQIDLNTVYNPSVMVDLNNQHAIDSSDSIGVLHNIIITEIIENTPNITTVTETRLKNIITQSLDSKGININNIPNSSFSFIHSIVQMKQTEDMFKEFENKFPAKKNELEIIRIYSKSLSLINEDSVSDYNDGFQDIINHSSISDSSKDLIKTTTSVAANSELLWNEIR